MDECDFCSAKGLDRNHRLAITDIERLRYLRNIIKTTKQRLASIEKNPKKNADDILLDRTILNNSKRAAHKLERVIL